MGCDIHSFVEVKQEGTWKQVEGVFPFDWRNYSVFAFLANVRNYDCCEPISEPRGLPSDVSNDIDFIYKDEEDYVHSTSYLTVKELIDFDYDKTFWNRRITRTIGNFTNGAALAEEGEGKIVTYRENLGEEFFQDLEELKELGEPENVRIVFWFDN